MYNHNLRNNMDNLYMDEQYRWANKQDTKERD